MRYIAAALVIAGYCFFCWLCWWQYRRKQLAPSLLPVTENTVVIGYASQTGNATRIATQTATQLQQAGMSVVLLPLNQLSAELLTHTTQLLLVISTYGEGEAPDNANRFLSRTLTQFTATHSLQHLQIGMLGLGDSTYQHFCGFAHELHKKLHPLGAHFLFDLVEVDRLDESSLRHWQYYLGSISGVTHFSDWTKPRYSEWQLIARNCINPGSPGAPAYDLRFVPLAESVTADLWQAGDIAEIGPANSHACIEQFLQQLERPSLSAQLIHRDLPQTPQQLAALKTLNDDAILASLPELPHREYSIASIPAEKTLNLLVRQMRDSVGELGLGSGWLTEHALLQHPVRLRLRSNPHFHGPSATVPMILIGNGTGIAGLRAHIAAREIQAATKTWLFFGERAAATDRFFHEDIQCWQRSGTLSQVDQVFSRDAGPGSPRYVQDLLLLHAQAITAWIADGAAIYVCGSLRGMAQGVDTALVAILGADCIEQLADSQRYCRDVY